MIAPRSNLIFWAGAVTMPCALAAAAEPGLAGPAGALVGVFLLLAVADALLARGRLDGIRATLPEVVRLTRDRQGEIDLTLDNDGGGARRLRLALPLPAELESPYQELAAALPEGERRSHVTWPCTGRRRGNYTLANVYLETRSPLALWVVRRTLPARTEVRVYPNLLGERKHLAALFLNRGLLGVHAQRQVGKGREFEQLRDYIPGDSYDDIHWKATAKRSRPITKVYQLERTQEVYVVLDASRLSARPVVERGRTVEGSADTPHARVTTQLERFITAAMVLGLVAEKQGDLFGIVAFDDRVQRFVRARNGKLHYSTCRDALYTLEPRLVNPDFGEVCSFIRLRLRRRALIMFLTNLDDPLLAESFVRHLDVVGRHHLVLVNMLTTPGIGPLFSDPNVNVTDDLYRRLGGHIQWRQLQELAKVLKRRGVTMTLLTDEMLCPQLVSQYINVKQRQIL